MILKKGNFALSHTFVVLIDPRFLGPNNIILEWWTHSGKNTNEQLPLPLLI